MFRICRRLTQPRIGITSCRVIAKFSTEQDLRVMRFISICLQLLEKKHHLQKNDCRNVFLLLLLLVMWLLAVLLSTVCLIVCTFSVLPTLANWMHAWFCVFSVFYRHSPNWGKPVPWWWTPSRFVRCLRSPLSFTTLAPASLIFSRWFSHVSSVLFSVYVKVQWVSVLNTLD